MSGDTPQFATSNLASNTYTSDQLFHGQTGVYRGPVGANWSSAGDQTTFSQGVLGPVSVLSQDVKPIVQITEDAGMADKPKRRLIQVIIIDPNENVPLDQCLIYRGEQKLTDATDQELFFELDIRDLLAKHNDKRVKMVDKKVKERIEHLDPAKVRDLKMVVVTAAEF
jgi:hypothetical protein